MELSPVQLRVVGSLVEKEMATPDNYPLSMNALLAACNQSTNRDPVVRLDQSTVENALLNLKGQGLARVVYAKGSRVDKYRHVLDEALGLDRSELALLSVLMLRGPQTAAELRTRCERLHRFDDASEVEAALRRLAGRDPSLVVYLPRQPGQKEQRWAHLLGGEAPPAPTPIGTDDIDVPQVTVVAGTPAPPDQQRLTELEARVATLEAALTDLQARLDAGG